MKIIANKEEILNNLYDLTLNDMGVLWVIAFLVDETGNFELNYDELHARFNLKGKSALQKSIRNLIEYHWIEKVQKNQYRTKQFKVK